MGALGRPVSSAQVRLPARIEPTTRQLARWGRNLIRAELAESGVAARTVVLNGNPPDVLVRHSANADLLVLGSRGHNAMAGLALGSTSDAASGMRPA